MPIVMPMMMFTKPAFKTVNEPSLA